MKLIRLSEACSRISGGCTFIYRLVLARGYSRSDGYVFLYRLVPARSYSRSDGYVFLYRLVPARGYSRLTILLYIVCSRSRLFHD